MGKDTFLIVFKLNTVGNRRVVDPGFLQGGGGAERDFADIAQLRNI